MAPNLCVHCLPIKSTLGLYGLKEILQVFIKDQKTNKHSRLIIALFEKQLSNRGKVAVNEWHLNRYRFHYIPFRKYPLLIGVSCKLTNTSNAKLE